MLFWLREWDTKLFSRHFERKKNLKNHKFSSKIDFYRKKGWFGACPSLPKSRKCFQNKIQTFLQLFQKRFFAANHCKKNYSILKIFIFFEKIEKKFFFQFFHRINILELKGHYRVILRSHRVSWGHWRSQVVMVMTSFPNYYVINDFIDRTSFLGQMDWNSVQNDIFAKIIKPIVI